VIFVFTPSLDKEEFNHVDGLDLDKDIWITLWMAHEGSKPMRMAKIEMLERQLNRFVMFDDEIPQEMFNRLKKMVNMAKALGSKGWTDHMLTERLMRAYTPMNYNVVDLIHQAGPTASTHPARVDSAPSISPPAPTQSHCPTTPPPDRAAHDRTYPVPHRVTPHTSLRHPVDSR
jgi:hypothetical protein